MTKRKKRVVRPNLGGKLRPHAESPRHRFLYTDVTQPEHEEIQQYCLENQISISQFLSELVLKDASQPLADRRQKATLTFEIDLTPEEQDKLALLARLHQKKSIGEYIREVIEPNLRVQRLHSPLKTRMLRFYLSEEEHQRVMARIASTGISARNYPAMLALKHVAKARTSAE